MVWKVILDVGTGVVGLDMIYMLIRLQSNQAVALRSKPGLAKHILQIVIPGGLKINYELFLKVFIEGIV